MAISEVPTLALPAKFSVKLFTIKSARKFTASTQIPDKVNSIPIVVRRFPVPVRRYVSTKTKARSDDDPITKSQDQVPNFETIWTFSSSIPVMLNFFKKSFKVIFSEKLPRSSAFTPRRILSVENGVNTTISEDFPLAYSNMLLIFSSKNIFNMFGEIKLERTATSLPFPPPATTLSRSRLLKDVEI